MTDKCPHPEKQRYPNRATATAAANVVRRKRDLSPDLKAYQCPGGSHWHVGHSQASLRFRIREARRKGIA